MSCLAINFLITGFHHLSIVGRHITLYINANQGIGRIGAYSDWLFEMARKFTFSIVCDGNFALFSGSYWFLREIGNCAAAR